MSGLDSLDKRILGAIQSDFPVCERPFRQIAQRLGISEETLIQRVAALKEKNVIRRFGAVFDSRKLGYVTTLVAVHIPEEVHLPAVAQEISKYPEVTHNYERENHYNLWFTIIASGKERITEIIDRVASLPGVSEVHNLPAEELYKIRADFKTENMDKES